MQPIKLIITEWEHMLNERMSEQKNLIPRATACGKNSPDRGKSWMMPEKPFPVIALNSAGCNHGKIMAEVFGLFNHNLM